MHMFDKIYHDCYFLSGYFAYLTTTFYFYIALSVNFVNSYRQHDVKL
jgi:hypothetical protein